MRVLYVGALQYWTKSSTSLNRYKAIFRISESCDIINTRRVRQRFLNKVLSKFFRLSLPVKLVDENNENNAVKDVVSVKSFDLIWIDKGITILPSTLLYIKTVLPDAKLVSYSPDNMVLRHNQSQQYLDGLKYYDLVVTNKSYIIDDLYGIGAKSVLFVNNSYESTFHYPRVLSTSDFMRLSADVCFVGAWERERCDSICFLVDNGIKVRVFGDGEWNNYKGYSPNLIVSPPLYGEDYAKVFTAVKISLCFLRKMNFDQQTTRSVEIPACGGFMLAERTDEHLSLFKEGVEAEYFSSNTELLNKCKYYLVHDDERLAIAAAGRVRCEESDYSNDGMVRRILSYLNFYGETC